MHPSVCTPLLLVRVLVLLILWHVHVHPVTDSEQAWSNLVWRVSYCRGVYPALPAHISAEGKDLVKRLLTTDPALRITWTELNRHPWLGGPGSSSSGSAANTSSSSNIAQAGPVSGAGTPNHACSSGGGVDAANGEGSRSGRGSEGGSDEVRVVTCVYPPGQVNLLPCAVTSPTLCPLRHMAH